MKIGKYRIISRFEDDLYYKFGLGIVFKKGSLGSRYDDPRQDLFIESKVYLFRKIIFMTVCWKGSNNGQEHI